MGTRVFEPLAALAQEPLPSRASNASSIPVDSIARLGILCFGRRRRLPIAMRENAVRRIDRVDP